MTTPLFVRRPRKDEAIHQFQAGLELCLVEQRGTPEGGRQEPAQRAQPPAKEMFQEPIV